MDKTNKENKLNSKKVYVSEETLTKLFTYKYSNKLKNMDEVINDLFKRIKRK